jgi:hypothetical protein
LSPAFAEPVCPIDRGEDPSLGLFGAYRVR